jgi:hypothetical protein
MYKLKSISMAILLLFMVTGCDTGDEHLRDNTIVNRIMKDQEQYVDFERFKEGRVCGEVKFMCLPESQDKSWQSVPTKDHIEDLELTPKVEKKYKLAIKASNKQYHAYMKKHPNATREEIMLITSLDRDFFEKVDARRFLEEMEQDLAKEFPGFWKEVPKKVRYRWIRRAMSKAKRFGYKGKKPVPMMELCARIGLDFDKDPKWYYIVNFITQDPLNIGTHMGIACNYIDWTIFEKTHSFTGTRITDWSMRRAHPGLPRPKKPYPPLHD